MNKNNTLLSICIPVYNQQDLVKTCIEKILESQLQNIEIVINDDCSTTPIENMVKSFSDTRLKYFRNKENLGHDRNIISSFMNASADYCFLLRSRDFILPQGLKEIYEYLENNTCAYLTTSAYDSNNVPKLVYNNYIYKMGADALNAHNNLYVHPSGSIYNKKYMNLTELDKFLVNLNISKYNFTVHTLMRLQLALKGDFVTLKTYSWVYSDTTESKDVAMNKSEKKISVYDTVYELERYKTVMLWCDHIMDSNYKYQQFLRIFSDFLYASTWNNKLVYNNKQLQKHYNFDYRKVRCNEERKIFLNYTKDIEKILNIENENYYINKRILILKNVTIDGMKYLWLLIRTKIPFKTKIKRILFSAFPILRR